MLTEIAHAPKIMTNVAAMIQPESFRKDLESYLKSRSPSTFLTELRSKLQVVIHPVYIFGITWASQLAPIF